MDLKKYCMMIRYKKHSYLEHKRKELHLLLKSDPNLFWKSFEEIDEPTLPFTPHEAVGYCTNLYTSCQSINDHFVPIIHLPNVYIGGNMGPHERPSTSQGWGYPWVRI